MQFAPFVPISHSPILKATSRELHKISITFNIYLENRNENWYFWVFKRALSYFVPCIIFKSLLYRRHFEIFLSTNSQPSQICWKYVGFSSWWAFVFSCSVVQIWLQILVICSLVNVNLNLNVFVSLEIFMKCFCKMNLRTICKHYHNFVFGLQDSCFERCKAFFAIYCSGYFTYRRNTRRKKEKLWTKRRNKGSRSLCNRLIAHVRNQLKHSDDFKVQELSQNSVYITVAIYIKLDFLFKLVKTENWNSDFYINLFVYRKNLCPLKNFRFASTPSF